MIRALILIGTLVILSACSSTMQTSLDTWSEAGDARIQPSPLAKRFVEVPELDGKKMTVAVYDFADKTGQRKPADNIANLSSAVTQGAESFLIDALKTAANGKWFRVVERTSLDALVRERQIIRSTREDFANQKGNEDAPTGIQPLLFAGILLEGGIIGYDSNIESGGRGARYLGIGSSVSYRRDVITVSLRGI